MTNVTNITKHGPLAKAFSNVAFKNIGEGITGGFSTINYKNQKWALRHQGQTYLITRPDDGTPATYLDVIIVGASDKLSKTWYKGAYQEGNSGAPDCASLDGITPDPGVPEPQSKLCVKCPHNEWGSGPGRGKACQDQKRMAVLLMPALTAKLLGSPLKDSVFLKVPPGSLKTLKLYADQLEHEGLLACAVITRLSFDPKQLFTIRFDLVQVLSDEDAPLVLPLLDAPITKRIIGEQPVIREVKMEPVERIETGLKAAFASPGASGGGHPEKHWPQQAQPKPQVQAVQPNNGGKPAIKPAAAAIPVEMTEAESTLDDEVAALLAKRVENMLK